MQEKPQEPAQPLMPSGGNGPPPPGQDILDQLTLDSFTATPSNITIGTSESVTLDWHVTEPAIPAARNIRFTLETDAGSFSVGPVGSQSAQISGPTTFSLIARLGRASADLGDVSITAIPNPACFTVTLTFPQFIDQASPAITDDATKKGGTKARLNGPPGGSIDTGGIHMELHFAVPTDVGIDIDVDVSMTLIPVITNGQLSLTYSNYSVDAHFPWWVNVFAPGVTTIVEEIIDSIINGKIKPQLPGRLQDAANTFMHPTPSTTIAHIQLQQGQLVATVCPS
jgi:hypothetical protein